MVRTREELRAHFETERELANRLRAAPREERLALYPALYDELYRRVPSHPQLVRKQDPEEQRTFTERQFRLLRRFLRPGCTFLEIGAGDCSVSFAAARIARRVYGIDVSAEIAKADTPPDNFELVISDGVSVPVPAASVDVAYSNQLMEHLHPDDARAQLENIHRALKPGGVYLCITPNRLSGPHDVSKHFTRVAQGFHLKEYTTRELCDLFADAGFSRVRPIVSLRGRSALWPQAPVRLAEMLLRAMPGGMRRAAANRQPFRALIGVQVAGFK